ncbi:concanavalin A-like lectin/glucanase domain-containing protein [Phellopilus nigrolimitatus]|nr:concanavalin A-like lectin/glucanase domain-containing protein [Phellopilus nigrolimitatus]
MFHALFFLLMVLFPRALAIISSFSSIDTSVHCGTFDFGPYTLFLNQFGMAGATSGTQCAHISALSGTTSLTNINLDANIGRQLSAIFSLSTTWEWSYDLSSDAVADVGYNPFTSTSPTGENMNEIMVWLANINAVPISATFGVDGQPVPVVSNISLAGQTRLTSPANSKEPLFGSNGANDVFSFLPNTAGATIQRFSADINDFLTFLVENQGLPRSQFLRFVVKPFYFII